jgi:hypothetical protein
MRRETNHKEGVYKIEFNKTEKFCIVVAEGNVTRVSTLDTMKMLVEDRQFGDDFSIIVDLRLSTFHPSYFEMLSINNHMVRMKEYFPNKIAIVTTGFLWVLGELTAQFSIQKGMNVKAFTDVEKAKEWIKETPEVS